MSFLGRPFIHFALYHIFMPMSSLHSVLGDILAVTDSLSAGKL